uniref:Uncharacterized protein n=1 Tax=Anguilla anguilla TaxID=7936 RepID=A0A0E9W4E8_ANGAN
MECCSDEGGFINPVSDGVSQPVTLKNQNALLSTAKPPTSWHRCVSVFGSTHLWAL